MSHHDQPGSIAGPAAPPSVPLVRSDGYELSAQLLDLLDEPGQVRLIGDLAGQHRHARKPPQLHAVKQDSERIAQLPAKDKPVPAASHLVAVHV